MKDAFKIAAVTLAGLFTAVFLYPFLHEGGHFLAAVIVGAEVKEFHLFPSPNILCDVHTVNIPGLIWIGLHGILFPFLLVCVVRPKKFWFWHINFVLRGICLLSFLISAAGFFLYTDGIYSIKCTVVDKAGNAFSEVHLEDQNGSPYVENRSGDDSLVVFSVNRDGSTFMLAQNTSDMVHQYYVQNVLDDVVVFEINADPLSEHHVTVNGKEVNENTDYSVTQEGGNGSWLKYTYTINRSLFDAEGEYKVVVSSKDKAKNDAFSDVKEASIDFVVDRTKPVVTVIGLAAGGRYQTDKQTVTLVPTDDGGALRSLVVRLVELDRDGNVTETVKELINLSGDELAEALEKNSGEIVFEIAEGLYNNVQIICDDCSVDADGNTNTYNDIIKNVSVSSSAVMIFWANKPLRWGSIAGVSAISIGLILLVVFKKRKKNKAEKK